MTRQATQSKQCNSAGVASAHMMRVWFGFAVAYTILIGGSCWFDEVMNDGAFRTVSVVMGCALLALWVLLALYWLAFGSLARSLVSTQEEGA